jgi:proteasome lid subunit RPN8/RPN11
MKFQALLDRANRLLDDFRWPYRLPPRLAARPTAASGPVNYRALQRVLVTDGVGRTLFEEYARHRGESRGDEETGWVLLGLRDADEAIALATLPAGAEREASVAHVRFNSTAQVLGSRIVRQSDRRLTILGVVHTHPGSLRHPSDGDLRGDREWVRNLRAREGVFGIGTADGVPAGATDFAFQPRTNVHCMGGLRFSWYVLGAEDAGYRPLPAELTIGPDLARPLHPLWPTLEAHAERIDRLFRQLAGVRFEVINDDWGPALVLTVPLATAGEAVRVVVRRKEVRYYLARGEEVFEVQHRDDYVDRGVFLLLAELAARADPDL